VRRILVLAFGGFAYLCFLAAVVAAVGFVGGAGFGRGIDDPPTADAPVAVAIDLALLALFGVSHSVMARAGFKRRWTKLVGSAAERSVYVLTTSAVLALMFWQWRALPQPIWTAHHPVAHAAILVVAFAGTLLAVASTFFTNHFDLFGLRQVWLHARGVPYTPVPFKQRALYGRVRHPLMLGLLLAFWAAPTMSWGHALFAAGMTAYIAIGVALEEKDLARNLGADYQRYRRDVPAIIPRVYRSPSRPDQR
jgi:protein-S-isoprenylcysteine O-methyltransferase Ste14